MSSVIDKAVGDVALIVFFYLLRIGKYTIKGAQNESKQTQQFKLADVTLFKCDKHGHLCQLPWHAYKDLIMAAESTTLKLDNQKMGGMAFAYTMNPMGMQCMIMYEQ
jgi:hypothetical protein